METRRLRFNDRDFKSQELVKIDGEEERIKLVIIFDRFMRREYVLDVERSPELG